MKKHTIITHEILFYEYEVEAESMDEAKSKVYENPIQDGVKLIRTDAEQPSYDPIIHAECAEIKDYPFSEGDTYYTLDGDEWIESCWDDVSEEMHDENPNKEYYTEPNKESKL